VLSKGWESRVLGIIMATLAVSHRRILATHFQLGSPGGLVVVIVLNPSRFTTTSVREGITLVPAKYQVSNKEHQTFSPETASFPTM